MPLPVTLALAYLAINLAVTVWIIRTEGRGHAVPAWLTITSRIVRYGPPLLALFTIVTVANDWPFFLFVVFFFGIAFWLLNGLLNYPTRPPKR